MKSVKENQYNSFAERIRELRISRGMSMDDFCEYVNSRTDCRLSKSTISRWESGHQEPMVSTVGALASTFNVSPLWLFGKSDDKYENNETKYDRLMNRSPSGSVLDLMIQLGEEHDEFLLGLIKDYHDMERSQRLRLLSYAMKLMEETNGSED